MSRLRWFGVGLFLVLATTALAEQRPMAVSDLFALKRVADPQVSPDGREVVYQVTTVSLESNKSTTALWVAATDGKTAPRQLTNPAGKADRHPRWSPDAKSILFESTRSGTSQLWLIAMDGGEARQLTTISTGASNGTWSPDGKRIAFVSDVDPNFSELPFAESDAKNKEKDEAEEKSPVKAKVFTRLFYRHWNEYVGDKRKHLFVIEADGKNARDVTPGNRDASPTSTTFSAGDDFTFTPDSKHLIFTAVPKVNEAWSTNYDLCRVSVDNKSTEWETLTKDNLAADNHPKVHGGKLYWRAQKKAGYEADKWDIMVRPLESEGAAQNLTEKADLSVNEFTFVGQTIVFTADKDGSSPLFKLETSGEAKLAIADGVVSSLSVGSTAARSGLNVLAYSSAKMDRPAEVMVVAGPGDSAFEGVGRPSANISKANDELLAKIDRPRPEAVDVPVEGVKVALGKMHMWILKPPGFDDKKKWPVVYLVHGGPQSAWEDGWSFRWNPQVWAAQGYVVVMPNPRGSTGFGQKFVDEISGDWGGKCYRDLVAGLEFVERLPYVDHHRIATAGASFGGYMQNWFAVNEIAKRFKCQINHCSVWNFESMWGTTDELWFDEWEHQGLPWEKPGAYAEFSPHKKAGNLGKYKTPMLVIHNDLDFRCPIGQGHELFSALQRQGVPSRFVNFPDEGHWVTKPKNSERWHKEVFDWLKKYCPPGGK